MPRVAELIAIARKLGGTLLHRLPVFPSFGRHWSRARGCCCGPEGLNNQIFPLNVRLAERRGKQSGVTGVKQWTAGRRKDPMSYTESPVQSGASVGVYGITNQGRTATGLGGTLQVQPIGRMGNEPAECSTSFLNRLSPPVCSQTPTSIRSGDSGAVSI